MTKSIKTMIKFISIIVICVIATTAIVSCHRQVAIKNNVKEAIIPVEQKKNPTLPDVNTRCKQYTPISKIILISKKSTDKVKATVNKAKVTAYWADPKHNPTNPGVTASGKRCYPGICAVSPDLFRKGWKFGQKVKIEGLGIRTIQDKSHPKNKNHVDIYMTRADANKFGLRRLTITLLN